MIEIQNIKNCSKEGIIDLLLDEKTHQFEIYLPKETVLFSSSSLDIANDYAVLAFSGQKLKNASDTFEYNYVSPSEHSSVCFKCEAKKIEKQLSFHASHDPLTGLHNRDIFDQEVRLAIHEMSDSDSDSQHALCHLSISQFTMINDTCGHRAGDKLLQRIGGILQQKIRAPSDAIARVGGDEFGILLRHCPLEAAERICEDITTEVSTQKFEYEDRSFDINIGIGIVPITSKTTDLGELNSYANTACDKAKAQGKNRVTGTHVRVSGQRRVRHAYGRCAERLAGWRCGDDGEPDGVQARGL